ncbi:MAG: hypothetical protein JWO33_1032 [Caulobacteraceae bacterium]|nr:hypothetical protein [Caulobacteraceae bacterium]
MNKLIMIGLAAAALTAMAGQASAQPRPMGDRDRDGVPNAMDQHNNNRGPMGDRDHDGRPNAVDNRDDRWDPSWGREVRAPSHWGARAGWNRHVRACKMRYNSYNPRTDTYMVRRHVTARCRL